MRRLIVVLSLLALAPLASAQDNNPKVIDSRLCVGPNCTTTNGINILALAAPQAGEFITQVRPAPSATYPFLKFRQRTTSNGADAHAFTFDIDSAGAFNIKDTVVASTPISISAAGVTTIANAVLTAGTFPSGSAFTSPTITTPTIVGNTILSGATGAGLQGATTVKVLVDAAAAVAVANVTMAANSYLGGYIDYSFEATDATDFQARSGHVPFSAVSKGSAITCTVGTVSTATEVVAVSAGTLAASFSCADATGGILALKATADTSLTPSANFPRVRYRVNVTNAGTVIAAQ